eukprot:GHRR01019797.1.p1 GENE.GHRR01019797.1~~GHRR01019797.1.p1  ORF type:complete len:128 (-),score=7.57 GHRR01019797.1:1305-1688(-)
MHSTPPAEPQRILARPFGADTSNVVRLCIKIVSYACGRSPSTGKQPQLLLLRHEFPYGCTPVTSVLCHCGVESCMQNVVQRYSRAFTGDRTEAIFNSLLALAYSLILPYMHHLPCKLSINQFRCARS